MRITVLAEKPGWHTDDLARAAVESGHVLRLQRWTTLTASVGAEQTNAFDELSQSDIVLLRTMPAGSLEQVVFRMDLLQRLETAGVTVINSPRSIECAVDKYLSLAKLEAAGLAVPPTIVCQRVAEARQAFEQLGGDVIIKPLFGSEGFGMTRITDAAMADRAFAQLERQAAVIYLQQYVPHEGRDFRLFVLAGNVIASMQRVSENWRTNIARGGRALPFEPDADMIAMAIKAAGACHCTLAGVDVLVDQHENRFVLEVNGVPGWRALTKTTNVDVAANVISILESNKIDHVHSTGNVPGKPGRLNR